MGVRHSHNHNTIRLGDIDNAEWEAPEKVPTCVVPERRPRERMLRHCAFCRRKFSIEAVGRRWTALRVPPRRRFGFFERLG